MIGPVAGTKAPRYVRLLLDATVYGVPGHGEIVVDRALGRFVRRFDAGPASEREGWDGTHPWRADATGMPRIEGNVDERGAIRAWARLLARSSADTVCDCGSRAPVVKLDPVGGHVSGVVLHVGERTERVSFGDYRAADTLAVPFTIADASDNGTWTAHVRAVETPSAVPAATFAPPAEPHDATLHGVAKVPLLAGQPLPSVDVSIDDGPQLRFLLDTGGQNAITPSAAKRMGLNVVGAGTVGGAGANLAVVRFASARSVRIGAAELRDQPFIVIDLGAAGFDGIVGYELFARFAARIDFAHESLELASDARELGGTGISVPMTVAERQPQDDGALDGIPGAVTIDTGSVSGADVNAPFVREHDLVAHYHAGPPTDAMYGVGGVVRASAARAGELRLGTLRIHDVPLQLTDAAAGGEANPTVAVNLGDQVLRRYTLVLDYRGGTIRFDPPRR
ncbi:MAG TPA: aspartyl protease family protein [Candidatus Elarobacter sp.]